MHKEATLDARNGTERHGTDAPSQASVALRVAPERQLIRPSGSWRHLLFTVQAAMPPSAPASRPPLALALVLDRSGSMAGPKLHTAKRAALAVLDRLSPADRGAVIVFDDHVDVLQPATSMTPERKQRVRALLDGVEARGSTALHEGWLMGCREIASDGASGAEDGLARCFLLSDGLANVGLHDPEAIASEAAQVRERAGVSTSTFGVGADYDEGLLGPMAVAGGGQFHHLRAEHEITSTFVGELSDLLLVAARDVRLEVAGPPGLGMDLVSQYWADHPEPGRWLVAVGDLGPDETRPVVARLWFPAGQIGAQHDVRARLVWKTSDGERVTPWDAVRFTCTTHDACDSERKDRAVLHWVGLHHADRAQRKAAGLSRAGQMTAARDLLATVRQRIAAYAGDDADLQAALGALAEKDMLLAERPASPMEAKEWHYQAQRRLRGQKDYRSP
jgi:Ca-activated chloride channel family protein